MRFTDARSGLAFDHATIEAATPEEAIAAAKMVDPSAPNMALDVAILTNAAGTVIWTLKAPSKRA